MDHAQIRISCASNTHAQRIRDWGNRTAALPILRSGLFPVRG